MRPGVDIAYPTVGVVLTVSVYTDLRRRLIKNWVVGGGVLAGVALALSAHGWAGLRAPVEGIAAGALWWPAVEWLHLGEGDAKLAMALGALLGPGVAILGPALRFMLCSLSLLPWIAWRKLRGLPWRQASVAMAPWIAAGTAAVLLVPR